MLACYVPLGLKKTGVRVEKAGVFSAELAVFCDSIGFEVWGENILRALPFFHPFPVFKGRRREPGVIRKKKNEWKKKI